MVPRHIYSKSFSFFLPFRPHLTSKFAKSANMIKNLFFAKMQSWVAKNAEFYADFESVKKLVRKKFSAKKWQKNGVFDFKYLIECKSFAPYKFFWVNFFSTDSDSASNFAFYNTELVSDCQCQSRNSPGLRSQHSPTRKNLRGGQMKQCWITYF